MSFQQDYLLRMLQDLNTFMTRLITLRRERKNEEALIELGEETAKLSGIPPALVYALSDDDMIETLQARGALESERCLALAELFRAEGEIYAELGEQFEAGLRLTKAIRFYAESLNRAEGNEGHAAVDGVKAALSFVHVPELPQPTIALLIEGLVATGAYAVADDTLYELLHDERDDARVALARNAYLQMLRADDAQLLSAGISRTEIESSISALDEPPESSLG